MLTPLIIGFELVVWVPLVPDDVVIATWFVVFLAMFFVFVLEQGDGIVIGSFGVLNAITEIDIIVVLFIAVVVVYTDATFVVVLILVDCDGKGVNVVLIAVVATAKNFVF